jgi:cyclopropane fatty-acyl-phospholipid synthase-like methyltransferase
MVDDGMMYTAVGHRGMSVCNPLGPDQFEEVLGLLEAGSVTSALDIGCGKGELLIRLAERGGSRGTGLDLNELLIEDGRDAAERRAPGLVQLHCVDAKSFPLAVDSYDVAAAIGAGQALGSTETTMRALAVAVRHAGRVALGELFWQREPTAAELAALHMNRHGLATLDQLVAACDAAQLETEAVVVAREQDFERYEWRHHRNIAAYARSHPGDEQARRLWTRRLLWRDLYLRAGRQVIGFAVIIARRV